MCLACTAILQSLQQRNLNPKFTANLKVMVSVHFLVCVLKAFLALKDVVQKEH
jgi:hypothetical protein